MSEENQGRETEPSANSDAAMDVERSESDANDEAVNLGLEQQSLEVESSTDAESLDPTEVATPSVETSIDAEADSEALTRLATEVESLRLQVEERTGQCVRIAADFDNFRKRTEREKSELELRVKRDAIGELLPVIDSFELARTQLKPQTEQEVNIHKSYQGVYKQLVDCLKRIGVSPMRVEGQPFDPNFHDAIMRESTADHPEGTVIEELRRGYLLGDIVLRHAMVKVAAPLENTEPVSETSISEVSSEAS
ncbi:nucleotide exchange factor GrpE [Altericista sp. CCNU0014]|uniref:nucleotide exchange factor GrpE n=1 Tax=Altericista sp. CCNU0014 TaxID=3082949 RepID=UPI00384DB5A8